MLAVAAQFAFDGSLPVEISGQMLWHNDCKIKGGVSSNLEFAVCE